MDCTMYNSHSPSPRGPHPALHLLGAGIQRHDVKHGVLILELLKHIVGSLSFEVSLWPTTRLANGCRARIAASFRSTQGPDCANVNATPRGASATYRVGLLM